MSDAATVQTVMIKRVRARVYRHPAPLPPWKATMLIGTPDQRTKHGWKWAATRNHSILNGEEKSAYRRRELLLIRVPDELADFDLGSLVSVLVP